MKYECELCGHIYNPEQKEEEEEEKLPLKTVSDNWACPSCGLSGFVFSIIP